ncbi:hypothetical protein D3C76_1239560 [compost metagenome]
MTNTAKWQTRIRYMCDGIVNAAASKRNFAQHFVLNSGVGSEQIQGEWFRPLYDFYDGFIQVTVTNDRQNRSKNLIFHRCCIPGLRINQCRFNEAIFLIRSSPIYHFGLIPLNQSRQTFKMSLVHDSPIVLVVLDIRTKERHDCCLHLCN